MSFFVIELEVLAIDTVYIFAGEDDSAIILTNEISLLRNKRDALGSARVGVSGRGTNIRKLVSVSSREDPVLDGVGLIFRGKEDGNPPPVVDWFQTDLCASRKIRAPSKLLWLPRPISAA